MLRALTFDFQRGQKWHLLFSEMNFFKNELSEVHVTLFISRRKSSKKAGTWNALKKNFN